MALHECPYSGNLKCQGTPFNIDQWIEFLKYMYRIADPDCVAVLHPGVALRLRALGLPRQQTHGR